MKKVLLGIGCCFLYLLMCTALADENLVHTVNGRAELIERWTSPDAPLLIYFPGAGERGCAEAAWEKVADRVSKDWNLICVTIYQDKGSNVEDWQMAIDGLLPILEKREAEGKYEGSNIYVDGESNGGAGAFYFTQRVNTGELGESQIKELTFLDGTIYYLISAENLKGILAVGTMVTVYVANWSDLKTSSQGKSLIKTLKGEMNFKGFLMECAHGNILKEAYKAGLHVG